MSTRRIVKKFIPRQVFKKVEPTGHLAEAVLLNAKGGFPLRRLNVIGVTGTNGKTTTSFMIHRLLQEAGFKVGLMTTVGYGVGMDIKPQIEHMTSVPTKLLIKRIKAFKKAGVEWVVLETTSHALAQNRNWGVPYSIAVMTNVTHEHLDYHGTFDRYVDAKKKLFIMANRNHNGLRYGVINADDPSADRFKRSIANPLLYGLKEGDLIAKNVKLTPNGSTFTVDSEVGKLNITCNIPGSFNVSNSLAALAVGIKLGLTKQQLEKGIAALKAVEGRMTNIDCGQPFSVVVDFAHTPDAFEKLFNDIRPLVKGNLIVMFGSAGRRDEAKRAIQGKLAGQSADIVVVTEEDDRDIDGLEIMDQIAGGAESAGKQRGKDLFLVHDRTEAIKAALKLAKSKDDTVLLLGKGHEKTIERADGEHPWDEIGIANDQLKAILK